MNTIKRTALLLLIFAFIIPAGCGKKPGGEMDPTGGITDTSAAGSATETLWTKVEPGELRMISTPPDDLLLIMAGGNDVSFYKGFSCANTIQFVVLTSKKLNDEITVTIDGIDTPYNSSSRLVLDDLKKATYSIFLCYQDIDWVLMGELYEAAMAAGENSPEYELYNEYNNLYFHEFVYMPDMKPELYRYNVYLIFSYFTYEKTGRDEFNRVTMTIDGTDYDVDIGRISIEYTYEGADDIVSNVFSIPEGINCSGDATSPGAGMYPNSDGLTEIGRSYGRVEMTFSRNATITGFRTFGGDTEIVSVELDVKREDVTVNQAWTGEPMYFPAMTTVIPMVKYKNKSLAGRLVHNGISYLVMDYELDGQQYSVCFNAPMTYGSEGAIELYAQEVDKVDLFPYYDNYLLRFWGLK